VTPSTTDRLRTSGVDLARLATAPLRTLPDFVIIGAQRAGTTSLYEFLVAHPDVRPAAKKEVHFFDRPPRRLLHYRAAFPIGPRRDSRSWRTGEATPSLLYQQSAPTRVAAALPDGRFVVLLRDPVDRAYSHWALEHSRGNELLDFEGAVAAEPARLASEPETNPKGGLAVLHRRASYVRRGEYADQLLRWFDAVGRDRILVVQSERLYREPAATTAALPAPQGHRVGTDGH
jgi:hypothetical protein